MDVFHEALAKWKGPEWLWAEVERRGLKTPSAYRAEVAAFCRERGLPSDVETYWAEEARERIFSCGEADPQFRVGLGSAPYRSRYLDELANFAEGRPSFLPPIHHAGLREWGKHLKVPPPDPNQSLVRRLERSKESERLRLGIDGAGWTGTKKGFTPILRRFAEARDFSEDRLPARWPLGPGKVFVRNGSGGLLAFAWVDTGGRPDALHRLPIALNVAHISDLERSFGLGLNYISPGALSYNSFFTPEMAVYGVYANVELLDAFVASFD
ncbi:MAG: hypothetical protein ACRED8_11425 [Caulobacteraceae bacterium]